MPTLDVASYLQPIPGDSPAGPNLEYEGEFIGFERLAQGRPEQQVGTSIIAAEEPDWRLVQTTALGLLARTKDLRIAVQLCRALVRTAGFAGLRDGIGLLRGLLEGFWDDVHPKLDPDDDFDPTMRLNALSGLADATAMIAPLRAAPLIEARALGRFTLKDIQIALGELPPSPASPDAPAPPELATIEAAFTQVELPALERITLAVHGALEDLAALDAFVVERVALVAVSGTGPDLARLLTLLRSAEKILAPRLAQRAAAEAASNGATHTAGTEDLMASTNGSGGSTFPAGVSTAVALPGGALRSRDDVGRALDAICDYYARNEPTSPVPLLLKRAKRMLHMDFMDIIRDMAPDAVGQIELIRGREPEQG